MGLHRCSCEKSGVIQAAEYPRAIFVLAPGLPGPRRAKYFAPDRLWALRGEAGDWPCLMFVPKVRIPNFLAQSGPQAVGPRGSPHGLPEARISLRTSSLLSLGSCCLAYKLHCLATMSFW